LVPTIRVNASEAVSLKPKEQNHPASFARDAPVTSFL
jgi:hypothetical protein